MGLRILHASHPLASLRSWYGGLSRPRRLVVFVTLTYSLAMSSLTVLKIYALRTYAWDLGAYSQSLWTTAYGGRLLYFTPDLPNNPTGSLFGAHFTPFLLTFVPLYALLPSPATILVAQTLAIAAGAPIVFRLAALRLRDERLAAVLAVAYLLNPAVEGVNWYDFHPEAFMMVFFLAAILAWEERAWLRYAVFAGLALSTLEMAGGVLAAVGAFWALDFVLRRRSARAALVAVEFRAAVASALLGAAWLILGVQVVRAVNPGNALLSGGTEYWRILGASSLLGVPVAAILDPARLAAALSYDGVLKLWYLVLLLAPLLFLPLRRPLALLPLAPWLVAALTSNFSTYYVVGTQYNAFVAPFLFYAAILGLERARRGNGNAVPAAGPSPLRLRRLLSREALLSPVKPIPLAAFAVAFFLVASPVGPLALGVSTFGGFPSYSAHDAFVLRVAGLVPPDASVLTQNNLFPLFADRSDAYVIPHSTYFPPGDSFNQSLQRYLNQSQYVLVDMATSVTEALVVLEAARTVPGFGMLAAADGAILLERGYGGPPKLFAPFNETYDARDLALVNGTVVPDSAAVSGAALASEPGHHGAFWTGPTIVLWPGTYTITFRVRVDPVPAGTVVTLALQLRPGYISILPRDVSSRDSAVSLSSGLLDCTQNLTLANLTTADFPDPAAYGTYRVPLTVDIFGVYDFSGFLPGTMSIVYLDQVTAVQGSAFGFIRTSACP